MRKANYVAWAMLFKKLVNEPMTPQDAVEETGLHLVTVQEMFRTLHRHKVIHVCGWEPDALERDAIKIYKFGPGRDVKRRAAKTHAERQRTYRERKHQRAMQQLINTMGRG